MVGMVQDQRVATEVNAVVGLLNLARSEALKRSSEVVVCPSADGRNCDRAESGQTRWERGIMVFVDADGDSEHSDGEPVVQMRSPSDRVSVKSATRSRVKFQANGMSSGYTNTLTVCTNGATKGSRYVIVHNYGRVRVDLLPGDGRIDEPHERCP
jgi:type IV fimbrial biogenesis protein FimT